MTIPQPMLSAVQDGSGSAAPSGGPNLIVLLGGMLLIMYFIAWRPERKQRQLKQAMLEALKKNDRVLTTGGMFATVAAVHDNEVVVKLDDGPTRVRMLKSSIAQVVDESRKDKGAGTATAGSAQ